MQTVADAIGVSKATVSYVLSGKRRISADVAERVWQAIDELGYKPNRAARVLASSKTHTIGLFCSPTATLREDTYFNQLLAGVLDAVEPRGYKITLYPERGGDHVADTARSLEDQALDGALLMNPRVDSHRLEEIESHDVPLVVIGTPSRGAEGFFYVDHDQAALMYRATSYLIGMGHSEILFINGPTEYAGSGQRVEGYRLALQEHGLESKAAYLRFSGITAEDGEQTTADALSSGLSFTAILTMNDIVAVGAIRALRAAERRCPKDVAVIGSGNTLIAPLHDPPLTSFNLYPYEQGQEAGNVMIDVIERRRLRPAHTIIPAELVRRVSA